MDDMVLFSGNKRQLRYAAYKLMELAGDMGLQVKPNWHVFLVEHARPVDVMGYRFSPRRTTLRKHIFRKSRRTLFRAERAERHGRPVSLRRSFRLASYHGYLKATDCRRFLASVKADIYFQLAFNRISHGTRTIHN